MLALNNLTKPKGKIKKAKRRGRGNASGRGNYSTRGMKGQRARSGGRSGLAGRSIKGYLLRIPKVRGFQSLHSQMAVVNIGNLNIFADGATINARELVKAGLIKTTENGLKVLSAGQLAKKGLIIEANAFSKEAVKKIEASGGQAVLKNFKKSQPKGQDAKDKKEKIVNKK
ncbi:MAG: 50S ribosomal protein L15 [Patescibacteria group bacterium]|nr:50S ribosomal protein L15 [Patescibacteria group bacterium]